MKRVLQGLAFVAIFAFLLAGSLSISNTPQAALAASGLAGTAQLQIRTPEAVPVRS